MIQSFIKSFVCIKRISLVVYHIIQSWIYHFQTRRLYLPQFLETFCGSILSAEKNFVQFEFFFDNYCKHYVLMENACVSEA